VRLISWTLRSGSKQLVPRQERKFRTGYRTEKFLFDQRTSSFQMKQDDEVVYTREERKKAQRGLTIQERKVNCRNLIKLLGKFEMKSLNWKRANVFRHWM
jgi:predicted amidophosphoribosyltransferase